MMKMCTERWASPESTERSVSLESTACAPDANPTRSYIALLYDLEQLYKDDYSFCNESFTLTLDEF